MGSTKIIDLGGGMALGLEERDEWFPAGFGVGSLRYRRVRLFSVDKESIQLTCDQARALRTALQDNAEFLTGAKR